jgi:serine/threonine protein kinase
MDITEVRHRFAAYGSGKLSQDELRNNIRDALSREPFLSPAYIALCEAYRRAQVIDAELYSSIVADIREITGPRPIPKAVPGTLLPEAANNDRAVATEVPSETPAPDTPVETSSEKNEAPPAASEPPDSDVIEVAAVVVPAEAVTGTGSTTGTGVTGTGGPGTGTGSAWDSPERLAEAATPLFAGSILNGRFQLIEELGRGGMGVVYKALDLQTADLGDRKRHVAIKVLNDDFKRHPLAVRSLQREARKAQKLAHPNIVTVHDFDRDAGNVYMELELLTGRSLDQVLRTEGKAGLRLGKVMEIVAALGAALGYAHEQGIVHSDFKPSNAFITDAGVVKVLDFGIARAAPTRADRGDKTIFDAGQLGAISPAYASLEMLNGEEPDVRDDVYALACVTYQLLTGRHPFNRIDAVKAREAKLQPARVRSLSFPQWRTLRQGLAFERTDRVPTVSEFVSRLTEPPRRSMWLAIAASIIIIAIASTVIIRRQWVAHRAGALQAELTASDPARYAAGLHDLREAPPHLRERVLLDDATRSAVLEHFSKAMQAAIAPPGYDYARANSLAADLRQLLPDSSQVVAVVQQLVLDRQAELRRQIEARDKLIHGGPFVASQSAVNLTAVLRIIQHIDPQDAALADPRVAATYRSAAETAADTGRADLGKEIADAGLEFAPTDASLLSLRDRIAAQQQRAADEHRATELEQHLATLSPNAPGFLDDVLANRDDLSALASVSPASPTLARIQLALQTIVLQRIKLQLADHDVAGARALLDNVSELLPEQTLTAARELVRDATDHEADRTRDTLDRLRLAAIRGQLEQKGTSGGAVEIYSQLKRAGASPDILAEARDLLAYGYLRQARHLWTQNDAHAAESAINAGIDLHASPALQKRLIAEQSLVSAASGGGDEKTRNTDAGLNAAREQFAESLLTSNLGLAELAVTAEALDRLEALGAPVKEVDSGMIQIENRVIDEVARLQQQSQSDRAQLFAQQAAATVLGSSRIADTARQLRHSTSRTEAGSSPEMLAQRNQLLDLVARPEATQRWATEIRKRIQALTPVVAANDPDLAEARHRAVVTFVSAAAEARTARNDKQATEMLETARTFDPKAAEIATESAAVERDHSAVQSQANDHARQASIESLKSQLAAQVAAGDMSGATTTAGTLRQVLGGSVYVAREMPQLLVQGYVHQARTQLAAGKVDEALDTLAAARKKFGTAPELKNLETRYVAIGDIFDRLRAAVALNTEDMRHGLEALRVAEGAEYAVVEAMLAHTLANRIADQRSASRASVVSGLLEAGQKIFPEFATALEHGTAGALPKSGIAIATEP